MIKPSHIPPTPGNSGSKGVQVPAVDLANVNVQVGNHPLDPSKKAMIIGPVMLVLPFEPDAARAVASALTGIDIVPTNFSRLGTPGILH